jgi:pimeloyl-ACP methyl ester carboxylesterase
METAVSFLNASGFRLHGVLHRPSDLSPDAPGVVWLSAGQKPRQGAWRVNVLLARHLTAMGFPVLRFDFEGLGDSEGERHHGRPVMDFYGLVQTGAYRQDVVRAATFLLDRVGPRPLTLGGLCGGAVSALFAAPLLGRRVRSLALVDLPVTISSSARQRFLEQHPEALVRARPDVADTVLMLYLRKLLDRDAWLRFLHGESNPRLFVEALRVKLRTALDTHVPKLPPFLRRGVDTLLGPAGDEAPAPTGAADSVATVRGEVRNELLGPLFREVLAAGQRVHFLNSSSYHPVFTTYFGQRELAGSAADLHARGVVLTVAPETNHIFSLDHSRRILFEAVERAVRDAGPPPHMTQPSALRA